MNTGLRHERVARKRSKQVDETLRREIEAEFRAHHDHEWLVIGRSRKRGGPDLKMGVPPRRRTRVHGWQRDADGWLAPMVPEPTAAVSNAHVTMCGILMDLAGLVLEGAKESGEAPVAALRLLERAYSSRYPEISVANLWAERMRVAVGVILQLPIADRRVVLKRPVLEILEDLFPIPLAPPPPAYVGERLLRWCVRHATLAERGGGRAKKITLRKLRTLLLDADALSRELRRTGEVGLAREVDAVAATSLRVQSLRGTAERRPPRKRRKRQSAKLARK